jgi:hypothetical protein
MPGVMALAWARRDLKENPPLGYAPRRTRGEVVSPCGDLGCGRRDAGKRAHSLKVSYRPNALTFTLTSPPVIPIRAADRAKPYTDSPAPAKGLRTKEVIERFLKRYGGWVMCALIIGSALCWAALGFAISR